MQRKYKNNAISVKKKLDLDWSICLTLENADHDTS